MSDTWKQWEGQIIDGKLPLLRYLGGSERSAVFLTERHEGDRLVSAAIKLIPADPENYELQLSRWEQAAELSNPHLIHLYEMGRVELGGVPFLYVVMEYAEENLAQVLPSRALTTEEARATLECALNVLGYLHEKGFVHGHIKPANIMAIGDLLKVSSDGLRRAGDPIDRPGNHDAYDPPENSRGIIPAPPAMSPAGDVWSLGVTIVESLTQKQPDVRLAGIQAAERQTEERQAPLAPQTLPEPFLDVANHCLLRHPQARWTAGQIVARMEGRTTLPEIRQVQPQAPTPVRVQKTSVRQSTPSTRHRSFAIPIAVGCVLVLAGVLAGQRLLRHNSQSSKVPTDTREKPLVQPEANQVAPPQQERRVKSSEPSLVRQEQNSKTPAPVPASIHPEKSDEAEISAVAKVPVGSVLRGEVTHRVMPEVLNSAKDTIRGTVRVRVKVDVDRLGNVEDAELDSPGPSKYFARAALQAAQLWKFKPPMAGSRGTLSSWILEFEFTHDGATVIPVQDAP
jgi:TonB family protein